MVETWPTAPGEEPSGLAFDAEHQRLFLGCGNKLMVMMDSETGKVVASVPIGQGVDATKFDPGTQLAFCSCGDGTVTIAHEDAPDKLTVVQTLKTEPRARTMALDLEHAPDLPGERQVRRAFRTALRWQEAAPERGPGHLQGAGLRHGEVVYPGRRPPAPSQPKRLISAG